MSAKSGFTSEKTPSQRVEIAARVAGAVVALSGVTASELAASAEADTSKNPLVALTDKRLKTIATGMSAQADSKTGRSYREAIKVSQQPVTRLVVVYKEPKLKAGKPNFDHLVAYLKKGETVPYIVSVIIGTPEPRFRVGEDFEMKETIKLKKEHNPRTYRIEDDHLDSAGVWHIGHAEFSDSTTAATRASNLPEVVDNITSLANDLINVASQLPPA